MLRCCSVGLGGALAVGGALGLWWRGWSASAFADLTNKTTTLRCSAGLGAVGLWCWWWRHVWRRREDRSFLGVLVGEGGGDEELTRVASRWVAAERSVESQREDALFDDPFAGSLGGESGRLFSAKMRVFYKKVFRWEEMHVTWVAVRTRFIDDAIEKFALEHDGGFQLVNLGCGLDVRAFRLACLVPSCRVTFEVDLPPVLEARGEWARREKVASGCPRVPVAVDLAVENLRGPLLVHGFKPDLPTFWLLEDLTVYLTEEANDRLLTEISGATMGHGQLCSGVVCDASKFPGTAKKKRGRAPFYAPTASGFHATLSKLGWTEVRVSKFGEKDLNFGRYPETREPDASHCLCFASR